MVGAVRHSPSLDVRTPDGQTRQVALRPGLVVGRAADADLVLDNPGVSRRHVLIGRDDAGRWTLRDLGSRNGTAVNGALVQEHVLAHGDVIGIADCLLTVDLAPDAGSTHDRLSHGPLEASSALRTDTLTVSALGDMGSPKVDTRHLFALQRLGRQLLETPEPDQRLRLLCRLMIADEMQGRFAAVVRIPLGAGPPLLLHGPEPATGQGGGFYLSQTVLHAVRQRREPLLAGSAGARPEVLELSIAQPDDPICVVACPLADAEDTLDLLYVIVPAPYGTAEWLALAALASEQHAQAEQAWRARRRAEEAAALERDLARARQVQLGLLPRSLDVPGFDVALHYEPCRGVGGDYLDVIPTRDGRVLLAVADVCGKGIQAALISASLHTFVHAAAASDAPLDAWMTRLNAYLRTSLPAGSFVTMAVVVADPATGALEVANAGHPPTILLDAGGQTQLLPLSENLPLGIDDQTIAVQQAMLAPGGLVALYTDGLTEIVLDDGAWLGHDGLAGALAEVRQGLGAAAPAARELAEALADHARRLQAGRDAEDDQTFLLARRLG